MPSLPYSDIALSLSLICVRFIILNISEIPHKAATFLPTVCVELLKFAPFYILSFPLLATWKCHRITAFRGTPRPLRYIISRPFFSIV